MSNDSVVKIPRGILSIASGTIDGFEVCSNGVLRIARDRKAEAEAKKAKSK